MPCRWWSSATRSAISATGDGADPHPQRRARPAVRRRSRAAPSPRTPVGEQRVDQRPRGLRPDAGLEALVRRLRGQPAQQGRQRVAVAPGRRRGSVSAVISAPGEEPDGSPPRRRGRGGSGSGRARSSRAAWRAPPYAAISRSAWARSTTRSPASWTTSSSRPGAGLDREPLPDRRCRRRSSGARWPGAAPGRPAAAEPERGAERVDEVAEVAHPADRDHPVGGEALAHGVQRDRHAERVRDDALEPAVPLRRARRSPPGGRGSCRRRPASRRGPRRRTRPGSSRRRRAR